MYLSDVLSIENRFMISCSHTLLDKVHSQFHDVLMIRPWHPLYSFPCRYELRLEILIRHLRPIHLRRGTTDYAHKVPKYQFDTCVLLHFQWDGERFNRRWFEVRFQFSVELWVWRTSEHGAWKWFTDVTWFFVCFSYGGLFERFVDVFSTFWEDEITRTSVA